MSGGVDSSVTAALLAEKDYDLSAVFMRNWDTRDESGTDVGCQWEKDWEDVQRVCKMLDIPCKMIDLSRQYWNRVFEPSLVDWQSGWITPNPDVSCNREVKFGALMKQVVTMPSQWLATGHYARLSWTSPHAEVARPRLLRAMDRGKDQAYYLSSLPEESLRSALFPLGSFLKSQVRQIAKDKGLPTASRAESMGICFVGERRRFHDFLSQYIEPTPGHIVDVNGHKIGEHQGLWSYTIGQSIRVPGLPCKHYVSGKDPTTNTIMAVPSPDHPQLQCHSVTLKEPLFIWPEDADRFFGGSDAATVQVRTGMEPISCTGYTGADGSIGARFSGPIRGVPPGQIAVFYEGDICLGSAKIAKTHCGTDSVVQ
ncbi:hypothetical protein FRC03_007727 [Tulasnella sp. 419]|nr:hypothetical protein FRC03_007727 [Tulasnella sp. 419]